MLPGFDRERRTAARPTQDMALLPFEWASTMWTMTSKLSRGKPRLKARRVASLGTPISPKKGATVHAGGSIFAHYGGRTFCSIRSPSLLTGIEYMETTRSRTHPDAELDFHKRGGRAIDSPKARSV